MREHEVRGKIVKQYRGRLYDRSRRDARGAFVQVSSRWFSTLIEAKGWLEDQRRNLQERGTLAADRSVTVEECCTKWIERSETVGMAGRAPISETTAERYRSTLRNVIAPEIGALRMNDLRASQLQTWVEDLALRAGHDAAHRSLGLLKMVYKYAVASEICPISPAESVSIAKRAAAADSEDGADTAPDAFMSPADVSALRRAFLRLSTTLVETNHDVRGMGEYQREQRRLAFGRWSLLFHLLLLTGMRLGEACALQWRHIDFDAKTVRVEQNRKRSGKVGVPKTKNSIRTIAVGDQMLEMFRAYGVKEPNVYVFSGKSSSPLNPRRFYDALALAMELALIEGWSPHDLRHYHASSQINKGVPAERVCDRLGHANVTITLSIYVHLFKALSGAGNRAGAEMEAELLG